MHSTIVRIQNVFGFFTTVAFTLAAVIALSSFIHPQTPSGTLELRNAVVRRGRPHYYSYKKEEYAHLTFDLDADLSTLFNWNTKQVFLYVKAVYPSLKPGVPDSEAIIWDAILPSSSSPWHVNHYIHPEPKDKKKSSASLKSSKQKKRSKAEMSQDPPYGFGVLKLDNQKPKYQITDISGKLQNRTDVRLELGWNVQPWVGALTWANRRDYGAWRGLKGGESEKFTMPEIGAKKVDMKDLRTEKGSEGYRLVVGEEQPMKKAVD